MSTLTDCLLAYGRLYPAGHAALWGRQVSWRHRWRQCWLGFKVTYDVTGPAAYVYPMQTGCTLLAWCCDGLLPCFDLICATTCCSVEARRRWWHVWV